MVLNHSSLVTENDGGGISSFVSTVTLNDDSGVVANTTPDRGGGILNTGQIFLNDQSTVADNVASLGGGIYNIAGFHPAASVTLNHRSSITGNAATGGQGGGVYSENGTFVFLNDASSIASNIPDDCFPSTSCQVT